MQAAKVNTAFPNPTALYSQILLFWRAWLLLIGRSLLPTDEAVRNCGRG